MHEEIQKLIEIQHYFAGVLFNSSGIDLKGLDSITSSLERIQKELEEKRKRTIKYRVQQVFKKFYDTFRLSRR